MKSLKLEGAMKKVSVIGLAASLMFGSLVGTNENVFAKEVIEKNLEIANYLETTGGIKVAYFNALLNDVAAREKLTLRYEINDREDFKKVLMDIEKKLPDRIEITSQIFTVKQIKEMYYEYSVFADVRDFPNLKTLLHYKVIKNTKTFILSDNVHVKKSVHEVYLSYSNFVKAVGAELKTENDNDSLLNVYNYVFNNFKYNADGVTKMVVGNIGNGEMACNGLSRLIKDLLNEVDIESNIRGGYSHFWNVVNLEGKETTIDVTTDILKKKRYYTLGDNSKLHKKKAIMGFYDAEYDVNKYNEVSNIKILLAG
ncbi:hypothetical protein ACIQZG_22655 [Lysinibacillus sp. NPDC096418]|uniref:hypothetical protein n=1 Tax=Lysinibacillus sp. NPDC096418 TaxID=3364138 RepID=UPI00380F2022